ncbi:hypothetical protein QUB70_19455 [Microcoleus sp. A003_D6]|uniref:hypothetical protein n=1 Tax=Microcoleus sp. A003_D6 TaxID=3055266 RepID=UPI002FD37294
MAQEFAPDSNESVSAALEEERPNDDSAAVSEQDVVLLTVVASPKGVRETILTLYRLGFAEVGDWSPVQRAANPKQVMSVLIRRRRSSSRAALTTDGTSPRTSGR